jgi:SNF2 family DNA or RNA helicase
MAWFHYTLSHTTPDALRELAALPGVSVRDRSVGVEDNAGWLVESILGKHQISFQTRVMRPDLAPLKAVADLCRVGLREWVPGFMAPYQTDAVLALGHKSGHLWHAAGSGKTITSIAWSLARPGNTLVVTRAAVRRNYGREIERFTEHRAHIIETAADAAPAVLEETDALFVVIGWEMLADCLDSILKWKPVNVIYDELHKCKSNKRWEATPTKEGKLTFSPRENMAYAAYKVSRLCTRRLGATATPVKDRVRDLWAQFDLVHPDAWGKFYSDDKPSFTGRYCAARRGTFGGIETTGSSNLDELWDRASLVTHHVPHSITHRHLPPRRRLVTYVKQSDQNASSGFQQAFKKAARTGGRGAILELKLMEAAAKKRKFLIEILEECVENKQKVVVFTGRREDCDKLAETVREKFGNAALVLSGHGGTPAGDRDDMQQQYMASPGPTILVGTGDAWGEGVNLQDSDLLLIAMLPYTPGQIIQWEGRVARHGQKRPVMIQYLVAEGSVDEHVAEILLTKLPAVERVAQDDSVQGLADQLRGSDQEEEILDSILAKLGGE